MWMLVVALMGDFFLALSLAELFVRSSYLIAKQEFYHLLAVLYSYFSYAF